MQVLVAFGSAACVRVGVQICKVEHWFLGGDRERSLLWHCCGPARLKILDRSNTLTFPCDCSPNPPRWFTAHSPTFQVTSISFCAAVLCAVKSWNPVFSRIELFVWTCGNCHSSLCYIVVIKRMQLCAQYEQCDFSGAASRFCFTLRLTREGEQLLCFVLFLQSQA